MNRRSLLLVSAVPAVLLACSQPPPSAGQGTAATTTPTPIAVAAAAPAVATATSAARPACEDEPITVPTEKFAEAARNFEEAKKALLDGYYDTGITEDDLYRAAVAGMLQRVDPKMHQWNRLLAPSELAELRSDLMGEVVGVGIGVEMDSATGYIDVQRVYPGSPAERAGIAPPDKIVTVNGRLYRGLTLHDAVNDIRGKAGETVTLSILRGDKLVSVPLVRQRVVFDQVSHMIVGDGVGYVAIPGFNSKTPQELKDALTDLASKGARALVFDMRHSPGGSFDDAVATVGEIVPAGSTVVSLTKRGKVETIVPKTTPVETSDPVAVLVDHETASSSELVAGALQELRHATVVGSKTKGKWTVQRVDDLPNGYAIKYTMALFATPGGRSFEGTGMAPDVEVDQADDATTRAQGEADPVKRVAEDVQLRTAVAMLGKAR
jgi:carboxyl-terminal processing protease